LVKEGHCKSHEVNRRTAIADYRKEQGLKEYDDLARGWRQRALKKSVLRPVDRQTEQDTEDDGE
jgi:hypothetical protein